VPEVQTLAGPRFAQYSALIQAALNGLGIGLVPELLVQNEVAEGLLVSPCGSPVHVDQGHYLCYRPDRLDQAAFAAFRAWILEEGARSRGFGEGGPF
jgi:DNA-binding transcriptional LysR family regulator